MESQPSNNDITEPSVDLTPAQLTRLEDLYGMFPRVTTTPSWKPTRFQNSFAIDTTNSVFYFYNFTTGAWASGGVSGINKEVMFNNAGTLAGDPNFEWDTAAVNLYLSGNVGILPRDTPSGNADSIGLESGSSLGGDGSGGYLIVAGGDGDGTGHGGDVQVIGGNGGFAGRNGDVTLGFGGMATNANGGFIVIPTCAGTPTGTPDNVGSVVFDTTNSKLYIYNGSWKSVTLT